MSVVKTKSGKISQFTLRNILRQQLDLQNIKSHIKELKERESILSEVLENYELEVISELRQGVKISEGSLSASIVTTEKLPRISWKTEFTKVASPEEAQIILDSRKPFKVENLQIVGD